MFWKKIVSRICSRVNSRQIALSCGAGVVTQDPGIFPEVHACLVAKRDLSAAMVRRVLEGMLSGTLGDAETATVLMSWRQKGETAEELAAAACVLREHMIRLDTGRDDVLDTCGTGGDACGTFNISTAAALIAAAMGVPVVKHG